MMQKCLASSIAFVVFAAISAAAQKPGSDQSAVHAVLMSQVDAWNRGDLEGYMDGYWKSPELVFFSNATETRGWQPTLDRYRKRYQGEGKQMGKLDFPSLEIVMLGPTSAMARGKWHLKMTDGKEL